MARWSVDLLDYPGASKTWASGFNDFGGISGTYMDIQGYQHAFLFQNGQFTSMDVPGANQNPAVHFEWDVELGTAGFGMNGTLDNVGEYLDPGSFARGWLRQGDQFNHIFFPGAATVPGTPGTGTSAIGINASRDIVGRYYAAGPPFVHRFLLRAGEYINIDPLNAGGSWGSHAPGINRHSDDVGVYTDNLDLFHGYLLIQGTYTDISYPGAFMSQGHSINDHGDITGTYYAYNGIRHGFVAIRQKP